MGKDFIEVRFPRQPLPPNPVKTTLDLSLFTVFSKNAASETKGKWFSVGKKGVTVSLEICKALPPGARVEFLLNPKGNILLMRQAVCGGLELRISGRKSPRVGCKALLEALIKRGVKLPARYEAEWDAELQAWVGRLKREE